MTVLFPQDHFLAGRSATSVESTQISWSQRPWKPLFCIPFCEGWLPGDLTTWYHILPLSPSPSSGLSLVSEKNAAFKFVHSDSGTWGKSHLQSQLLSEGQSRGSWLSSHLSPRSAPSLHPRLWQSCEQSWTGHPWKVPILGLWGNH